MTCEHSNQSLVYQQVYEATFSKFMGISVALVNMFALTPYLALIIKYIETNTRHEKTLVNRLIKSSSWCAIVFNLFQVPMDIILMGFAPLNKIFCYFMAVSRNVISVHYLCLQSGILVAKLIYMAGKRNPFSIYDDFLIVFVNLAIFVNAAVFQISIFCLPGKITYIYYVCSNGNPDKEMNVVTNYPFIMTFILTFLIYICVIIVEKIYKIREIREMHALSIRSR